jgi:hypothetical protein
VAFSTPINGVNQRLSTDLDFIGVEKRLQALTNRAFYQRFSTFING